MTASTTNYRLKIGTEVTGANKIKRLGNSMQGVQGKAKNLALSMKGLATGLAAAAAAAASFRAISRSLDVFSERSADLRILVTGLSRVTQDAPKAARELKAIGDELGLATLFDERDFIKGFNLLTSFKNIGVDSYKRVAESAADLAQINQVDLKTSFMQLAKALQDPERNLAQLNRSGIDFSETLRKQIIALNKSGRVLEAQSLILKNVEGSYQNTARAAAKGLAGAFDTLGQRFRDFQEQLGKLITPFLQPLIQGITQVIEAATSGLKSIIQIMPRVIDMTAILVKITATYAATWTALAAGKALGAILKGAKLLLDMEKAKLALVKARAVLEAAIASKNIWGALAVGTGAFVAISKVIDAATDSVKGLYAELDKTLEALGAKPGTKEGEKGKGGFLSGIKDGIDAYIGSIKSLAESVSSIVQKTFKGLEDALVRFVQTGKLEFSSLVQSILADIARLTIQKTITGPLSTILSSALQSVFSGIGGNTTQAVTESVTSSTSGVANQLQQQFGDGGYGTSGGTGMLYGRALGGPVLGGQSYVVGEQGPELFTPTSNGNISANHSAVMDRYSSNGGTVSSEGGVGGVSGSSGGGGAAVIDIRYNVETINSVDYVTAAEFQQGMAQAAKEGAKKGEQATLNKLQNSTSTRRRVGV